VDFRVTLAWLVRADSKLDGSTVEAFKKSVLRQNVAIPGSTSGIWLTTDLFRGLGIAERSRHGDCRARTDATGRSPHWSARILRRAGQ